jgi:hypothetical protein
LQIDVEPNRRMRASTGGVYSWPLYDRHEPKVKKARNQGNSWRFVTFSWITKTPLQPVG